MGAGAGRIRGQPRVLVLDPQIHQDSPSSVSLLNPNEVIAMRENQIQERGEEEDNNGGKKNPDGKRPSDKVAFSGDTASARNVVLNTIHPLCLET